MSSSVHANNKIKYIIIPSERITQIVNTTLTAEKTATKKKLCLSLHYNGLNSYLFVNGSEIIKFNSKDSEIVANTLCLGSISEDFSVANMKKSGFHGSAFAFSTGYKITAVADILDIYNYLMKKNGI